MKLITSGSPAIKIILIVLLVWIAQTLFLHEAVNNGISGDDLNQLFYFHVYRGDLLSQLPFIWNDQTIYLKQQIYYLGLINGVFGFLNIEAFQIIQLFFKSLAVLSLSFLIYTILKNKIFAFLTALFFIISPSTTGVFELILYSTGYLSLVFTCFFILFYIQSFKENRKILLASLFFFLAIVSCPPRAFPIAIIPLLVEAVRLTKEFKPFIFLRRLLIFYSLLYILIGRDSKHVGGSWIVHLYDFTAGNYYSISYPLQVLSSLFIDKSFLGYIFGKFNSVDLIPAFVLHLLLIPISISLGLITKIKRFCSFLIKITLSTILLQILLYLLGLYSHDLPPGYAIKQLVNFNNISFLQASIGGYYIIFGFLLALEWWQNQRNNKVIKVLVLAWLWSIISLILIWLSAGGVRIDEQQDRRYVLFISLGSVVFTAGIFTLAIERLQEIRKQRIKLLLYILLSITLLTISFCNYSFLNRYFYIKNQQTGFASYWQKLIYQRFINSFGRDNLYKDALIYIDYSKIKEPNFHTNSVGLFYKLLFYDLGLLIRDNCKAIVYDLNLLKKSYTTVNGKRGFMLDSSPSLCINPVIGQDSKTYFYSLDNFYAYAFQNREFIDIREEIINQFN